MCNQSFFVFQGHGNVAEKWKNEKKCFRTENLKLIQTKQKTNRLVQLVYFTCFTYLEFSDSHFDVLQKTTFYGRIMMVSNEATNELKFRMSSNQNFEKRNLLISKF